MSNRWWIRIATSTTTNKKLAIWKAQSGKLDTESFDYMKKKYLASAYFSVRQLLQPEQWFSNQQVQELGSGTHSMTANTYFN